MPSKAPTKRSVKKAAAKPLTDKPELDLQVLATYTTKSVSGTSTLKYQFGVDLKSDIHIRIVGSSGKGYVNPDWVQFSVILEILDALPTDASFSSSIFAKALPGHSNNNVGFLTACLINEKVLVPVGGQDKFKWKYLGDADDLLAKVESLKQKKAAK